MKKVEFWACVPGSDGAAAACFNTTRRTYIPEPHRKARIFDKRASPDPIWGKVISVEETRSLAKVFVRLEPDDAEKFFALILSPA